MWHDNETDKDLLGFEIHSNLIKEIVLDPNMLPISIGLFGDWGSGKSSILKMLDNNLQPEEKIVVIKFNGWVFEGYDDAKSALIETILKTLVDNKKISAKGKESATKLLKKVDLLRLGKLAVGKIGIPIAKAYATGGVSLIEDTISKAVELFDTPEEILSKLGSEEGSKLKDELKSIMKSGEESKNEIPEVVRDFRDEFEKTIDDCEIDSLVIMVDDLDRCSPDRIIDNLEAIKLFLNVRKTAFIIGADRRIVRHAIQHRFKAKDLRDSEIKDYESLVTDYLEKFIQVPYSLPKLSDTEVETYLSLLFCQNELDSEKFNSVVDSFQAFRIKDRHSTFGFKNIELALGSSDSLERLSIIPTLAPLVTEGLKGNPRQIKRFLNAYVIRKKLADVAKIEDFRDDVLIKLMILEYMAYDRFQDLFKMQAESSGFPELILKVESNDDIDAELKENSAWDKVNVKKWLFMEPKLKDVDLRDYFWISRDRLSVSLETSNLVPPIVKALYSELIKITSGSAIETEIEGIGHKLETEDYIEKFVTLVCDAIIKDVKTKVNHQIMLYLIIKFPQFITNYFDALNSVSVNAIPVIAGTNIKTLKTKGMDVQKGIDILEKNKTSRAYKAFNAGLLKGK